jgi:hypothetical protein
MIILADNIIKILHQDKNGDPSVNKYLDEAIKMKKIEA